MSVVYWPNRSQPIRDPVSDPVLDPVPRRPYVCPAVLSELKLETRAGSALGVDPLFDPTNGLFMNGFGGE